MVVYILSMKADLQSVATLALAGDRAICLDVRNPQDTGQIREKIVVDCSAFEPEEEIPKHHVHHKSKSKHDAHATRKHHFSLKWNAGDPKATIRVVDPAEAKERHGCRDYTASDSGAFVPIGALECDGIEPFQFHAMGEEFSVTSTDGATFEKVDLNEGAWSSYEWSTGSTSITNFCTKLE